MTDRHLAQLLHDLGDTREIVIGRREAAPAPGEELLAVWRVAEAEAEAAYALWREHPGGESFSAFRAAQDRSDAGQDALAASCARQSSGGPQD
jgi:hypothetical protein